MSSIPQSKSSIEVFFSYSHQDEKLRVELEKQLSVLKWQDLISGWHDRQITAGLEWSHEIDTHLNSAQVILLLISPDFMASQYCYGIEVKRAMERHEAGEALVIPIILRSVDWKGAPFDKIQSLPTNAKPVTSWHNHDEAFTDIAQGIRKSVEELIRKEAHRYYTAILEAQDTVAEAYELFSGEDIWPDQCNNAIETLRSLSGPVRMLYQLLDKYTQLFAEIRYPFVRVLHHIDDVVSDLIQPIQTYSMICQTSSTQVIMQRQEIQRRLEQLKQSLNEIKVSFVKLSIQPQIEIDFKSSDVIEPQPAQQSLATSQSITTTSTNQLNLNKVDSFKLRVLPLTVVDNSTFFPIRLTVPSDAPYDQEALSCSHFKWRGLYDLSCLLDLARVLPPPCSGAALASFLAPPSAFPLTSREQTQDDPPSSQATHPA